MVVASNEVIIKAPLSKVWPLLGDVKQWASWNKRVSGGRMTNGEVFFPASGFQYSFDGKMQNATITQIEQRKTLAWRTENAKFMLRFEQMGDNTKVSCEHEVSGFMINLRKAKSEQEANQVCSDWLNNLKAAAEAKS